MNKRSKNISSIILILLHVFTITCVAQQSNQGNKLRVFALDGEYLISVKAKLASGQSDVKEAYNTLLKNADKAMLEGPFTVINKKQMPPSGDKHDYVSLAPYHWPNPNTPDGLPYIRKDGQRNPEVKDYQDKNDMTKMVGYVEVLAVAYFYSNDEKYAKRAALLLRTWFVSPATHMNPNLNHGQMIKGKNYGRGAGMIDLRRFVRIIDAIGLLQSSKNWTSIDQTGMETWFKDFLNWMQSSPNGKDEMDAPNNHGTWYDAQRLSYALFLRNDSLASAIVRNSQKRLNSQLDADTMFPFEMERTKSLHYSVLNLQAHFLIASMAESINLNIWKSAIGDNKSILTAFEKLFPFISNQKHWEGKQIEPYDWEESVPVLCMAANKYQKPEYAQSVNNLNVEDKIKKWMLLTIRSVE